MTTPKRLDLQIGPFCNCNGCMKKVKRALGKLYDVKVLAMDPEIGKLTILTSNDPEAIKDALKRVFPKRNINLAQEISSQTHSMMRVPDVDDMAKALLTMSQVKGVESVEYTQTSTYKINFTSSRNQPTLSSLPRSTLHDLQGSIGVHFEDTPSPSPLPSPPPPRTYIRPSAPPMPTSPPPLLPLTYMRPSAPPMPTPPDLVFGYPLEFYGYDENHPHGSGSIL